MIKVVNVVNKKERRRKSEGMTFVANADATSITSAGDIAKLSNLSGTKNNITSTIHPIMAHHRKVELQSPADFTYLYANTVALSRRQVDLHLPPSALENETPDPMRERVRELVDDVSIYLALELTLYPEKKKTSI